MQRLKDEKRQQISATAARLFATRPFHKVRLDDVAAAARVGKGTLYCYFDSKEDLYLSLIQDGMRRMVDRLAEQLADESIPARESLRRIIAELVAFSFSHPDFFELIRNMGPLPRRSHWRESRERLMRLIVQTILRGNRNGEFCDPQPRMTALFIPGMIRSAMVFPPPGLTEKILTAQIQRMIEQGIVKE